jgi:signal peptidase
MHMTPTAVADPVHDAPKAPRRVAALAIRTASYAVIGAISTVLIVSVVVPRIAGAQPYTIETGSMQPKLPPGTLVVVKPIEPRDIGIGDVLTYQLRPGEPAVVTHRVVAQGVDGGGRPVFWTKGDANSATDARPVRSVQVRGKLWYSVPYVGYLGALLSPTQRNVLLLAAITGLFGYSLGVLMIALRRRQKAAVT